MTSAAYRGELFLTLEEATEYNKNLEKACLEIYGFQSGFVPWRICAIDQSIRTHTPSSLSLATALRELDATVDPLTIINQPVNRRSSYRLDSSPVRSPPSPPSPPSASPPPPEIKVEPKPIKVEEKIEFDPESDIYKLLHPSPDKLNTLPQWLQSVHKILKVLCYMPEIKPFLKYFNYNKASVGPNNELMDLDRNDAKSDKMDDLGFDVLTDDLDDILMDIDSIGPSTSRSSAHENSKELEDEMKLELEFENVDDSAKHEGVNYLNGSSTHPPADSDKLTSDLNDSLKPTEPAGSNTNDLNNPDESKDQPSHHDMLHMPGQANHLNGTDSTDLFKSTEDLAQLNVKGLSSDVNDSVDVSMTNGTADSNIDNESTLDHTTQVRFDTNTTKHTHSKSPFNAEMAHGRRRLTEHRGFEYVLEKILENKFENSSYLFSVLYCYLLYQLKVAIPGSHEWMSAQVIAVKLDELRREHQLKDAEKLHNFPDPEQPDPVVLPAAELQAPAEPKKPRTSMEDFEHELALINNVNDYSPTISLPEVKSITDEERMEFYENAMLLDQEFQLELFTVFEHAAVWKLVGNGEIELDDQNTDPKIYRGMIKWVKEKRNSTPAEAKQETLEMPKVSSEIVV